AAGMTKANPSSQLTPRLVVSDARAALAFYAKAFAAKQTMCLDDPKIGGKIVHAEMSLRESTFSLAGENPARTTPAPKPPGAPRGRKAGGGAAVALDIEVDGPDAIAARAVEAGATVVFPIEDQFYGYRTGRIRDPFGHEWILSKKLEDLTEDQMRVRMAEWWK